MSLKNRPKDFFAKQIRSSHLIASGGIIDPKSPDLNGEFENLRLMVYPKETVQDLDGAFEGLVPKTLLYQGTAGTGPRVVGNDVWLFISGSTSSATGATGAVLFGGNVVVSGSLTVIGTTATGTGILSPWDWVDVDSTTALGGDLVTLKDKNNLVGLGTNDPVQKLHVYAGDSLSTAIRIESNEKDDEGAVINPGASVKLEMVIDGTVHSTLSQNVKPGKTSDVGTDLLLQNHTVGGGIYLTTKHTYSATDYALAPLVIDSNENPEGTELQVRILSGTTGNHGPDPRKFSDTNFFVSGSIGSCASGVDNGDRGTAVFGGDIFVSGGLYVDGTASIQGSVNIADVIVVGGTASFESDVQIDNAINISGTASFENNVYIEGDVYVGTPGELVLTEPAAETLIISTTRAVITVGTANATAGYESYTNPLGKTEARIVLESSSLFNYVSVECATGENLLIELPSTVGATGTTFVIKDKFGNIDGDNTCIRVAPPAGEYLDQYEGWVYSEEPIAATAGTGGVPLLYEIPYACANIFSDGTKWLIF